MFINFVLWTERYQPKFVHELTGQHEVAELLTQALKMTTLPHLIFYGPPGTGKTSCALAIARKLYRNTRFKSNFVMELNASDERGIRTVRTKIKTFAANAISTTSNQKQSPKFKLLILDEADNITADAQHALRRTIEVYSRVTRFCFICNYVSRIIEPIASRCLKLRFKPINESIINKQLITICERERVTIKHTLLKAIAKTSRGDLRNAITNLQLEVSKSKNDEAQLTSSLFGNVPEKAVSNIWTAWCLKTVRDEVGGVISDGYPAQHVMLILLEQNLREKNVRDYEKAKIAEHLAQADEAIVEGSDEYLQLFKVAASISTILKDVKIPHH